ncbi:hypothetical protein [Dyella ginsengisoli]|uniref:hypothetical protein n=1 Tax=Dyella ginsengisoli TaxID=363848 RepID=UPI0003626DA5|nr:hypothetical protein [Dyella ginsengisoli]
MKTPSSSTGFGLFETILALALGLALTTASVAVFSPASGAASAEQEISRLDHLHDAVTTAYASRQNFSDLAAYTASQQGWLQDGSGNWHSTAWGALSLANANLGGMPADGWQVELDTLPADVCQRIAGAEAGRWTHVYVDGQEVTEAADATKLCTSGTHTLIAQSYGGPRPGYSKQPIFHYADAQCVDARAKGIVNPTYCPSEPQA